MKTKMSKKAASAVPNPPKDAGPVTSGGEEKKWRAEDALRTLTRAEEVRGDQELMRDVERMKREKMRQLASISCEVAPKTMKMPK